MMNKEDELLQLRKDIIIPVKIERYKRNQFIKIPMIILGITMIWFISGCKYNPLFAYSFKGIPILDNIAYIYSDAVIKEFIKNDYAYYIGDKQGDKNPLILEYMVIDETQIIFYQWKMTKTLKI